MVKHSIFSEKNLALLSLLNAYVFQIKILYGQHLTDPIFIETINLNSIYLKNITKETIILQIKCLI